MLCPVLCSSGLFVFVWACSVSVMPCWYFGVIEVLNMCRMDDILAHGKWIISQP